MYWYEVFSGILLVLVVAYCLFHVFIWKPKERERQKLARLNRYSQKLEKRPTDPEYWTGI